MAKNEPSLIVFAVGILVVVYLFGTYQSSVFAEFTRVFHENIETVMLIVLVMLVALYYLRIHGISTETDIENENESEPEPFCGAKEPSQEDTWCQTLLSGKNCTSTSCCVLLNGTKCVGGTSSGPTYLTRNGKNVDFDYFEYKSRDDGSVKCRGKCPKETN